MSVLSWRRTPHLNFPHLALAIFFVTTVGVGAAHGQDSIPPIEQGVRLGITYTPGMRPGMLVLGGSPREMLDSVRTILQRDLEFSDRFEMIFLPGGDSLVLGVRMSPADGETDSMSGPSIAEPFVNYSLYAALGADYAVSVLPAVDSSFSVNLYAVRGEEVRTTVRLPDMDPHSGSFRMAVHRASDVLVRAATGEQGIAASRVVFVSRGRVYSVDSDGAGRQAITAAGTSSFSPVWGPSALRVAYTQLADDGWGSIFVYDFETGTRSAVANTEEYLNYSFLITLISALCKRTCSAATMGRNKAINVYNFGEELEPAAKHVVVSGCGTTAPTATATTDSSGVAHGAFHLV